MKPILKLSLCLCLLIGVHIHSNAQQKNTVPTGKILDNENLFTTAQIKNLEEQMQGFIKTTKIPMSIMVMSKPNASTGNGWTIGNTTSPKGVLITIDKTSKNFSIGVGNELSKTLTKTKVEGIFNTHVLPEFEKKQYKTGLSKAIKMLLKELVR
jgi:uncharacterized membrane protein YgcG